MVNDDGQTSLRNNIIIDNFALEGQVIYLINSVTENTMSNNTY